MLAQSHVRLARPTRDLAAAELFWAGGLGLSVLHRGLPDPTTPGADHALLMLGWPEAGWHLELTLSMSEPVEPTPTPEDLLVVYLDGPVPEELVERLRRHGGQRVPALNPYWDRWGVTVEDPDGYRLVLCTRQWHNE